MLSERLPAERRAAAADAAEEGRRSPGRILRRVVLLLAVPVGALALTAALVLWLAVSAQPALPPAPDWTLTELSRVKAVVGDDLRRGPSPQRVLTLTQRDLEILIGQALRGWGAPRIAIELDTGRARARASLALPRSLPGGWLNLDARLNDSEGLPGFDGLRIGALPLPGWLADALLDAAMQRALATPQGEAAARIVQRVSFVRGQVKVEVDWPDDRSRAFAPPLAPEELARWRAYADALAAHSARLAPRRTVSMTELLLPLFALARERSARGDAAAENRTALLVLTLYANGRSLASIVPPARHWPAPRPLQLTLNGRTDTPLHYLISAAVAAEGGGPLADTVGLYKEASDAQGGSGFSFNDLAADRAGTRFGLLAKSAPRRLQELLAEVPGERDLVPEVADLPEGLSAGEFAARYGHVGSPAYEHLLAEIEARIDRCRVLDGRRDRP